MFEVGPQRLPGNKVENKPLSHRKEKIKVVMDINVAGHTVLVNLRPATPNMDFAGGRVSFELNSPVRMVTVSTKTQYASGFMYVFVLLKINDGICRSYLHMDAGWMSHGIENLDSCTFTSHYMAYIYSRTGSIGKEESFVRVYDILNGPSRHVFEDEVKPPSLSLIHI